MDEADLHAARERYRGHCHRDAFLRPYEKRVLVHSTTAQAAAEILRDGCLKSWSMLKREGRIAEPQPIGSLLGDPPDYSGYIMFNHGGSSAERVVASWQYGRIEMDLDRPYVPGARFYFDAGKIAADSLLVRDGAHLKVKDRLPLEKYLIWTATPDVFGIEGETTPRHFAELADRAFQERFGISL